MRSYRYIKLRLSSDHHDIGHGCSRPLRALGRCSARSYIIPIFGENDSDSHIGPTPSNLTIILDTNPHAWALLTENLSLASTISNLLIFINAHLAMNPANQVAVIASHTHRALYLYPKPPSSDMEDTEMGNTSSNLDNANKYRPFALIEHCILTSLRELLDNTTESDITSTHTTQVAGALTLALSHINKTSLAYSGQSSMNTEPTTKPTITTDDTFTGLQSRILVISVSGDLAHQYIPIMNTTFAAQRLRIPIDILKLAGDTVFLQQASDATKGTYMQLKNPQGLLQYLMMAFLPDQVARKNLVAPTAEVVDFRAACFCHRRVVDVGYVCSICLSSKSTFLPPFHISLFRQALGLSTIATRLLILPSSVFCEPPPGAICLTCSTHLTLGAYGSAKPAVIPRKKKKKRKLNGVGGVETGSARGTPAPGE